MVLMTNNPFGDDEADANEESYASRVGRRIRAIRTDKGMSQADLGQAVGLSADRIQKYENGYRKPKLDMLKQFASILGVKTIALLDPVVSNYIGAMFAFFEMEERRDLELIKNDGKYFLQFGDGSTGIMNEYLKEWYDEKETTRVRMEVASEEEKEAILREYRDWERTFPKALTDRMAKISKKEQLQNAMAIIQEQIDSLDDNN